ncbi:hypothetical protein Celal_2839 [Cellulophaga algicola DSM 14237]|uniref:Uncharacterized protein n=1 Tax=Cellulophaga algicola (strain DSM 14237 / IC166 / ACAM 630) TaxID=688270 RepID=E6XCX7_CELAD|nr:MULTISPECIES: hypothetical protein [Cellulophaga]ADV50118.1 hypothetical protein Celal_2839 [Cellulophaga algicola DSM 14237]
MDKITEEIELSSKAKNKSFMLGGIFLVGTLIISAMTKTLVLMPLIFGILFIVIGFLNMNIKAFKFYEKHLVFQAGFINKKMVLYKDLEGYNIEKRKIIIHYKEAGKLKSLKLLKEIIADEDITVLQRKLDLLLKK